MSQSHEVTVSRHENPQPLVGRLRTRREFVGFCSDARVGSECERAVAHATRGGDGRQEGCECGYYDLHRNLNKTFLHDSSLFILHSSLRLNRRHRHRRCRALHHHRDSRCHRCRSANHCHRSDSEAHPRPPHDSQCSSWAVRSRCRPWSIRRG